MKHFDNLQEHVPDLAEHNILDLGSGRGGFLIDCAQRGVKAIGLELSKEYIAESRKKAAEAGVLIDVRQGAGEQLPFQSAMFGFVNLSEVIEHVQNPESLLREVRRVLEPDGKAYLSVPNRFCFFDPHYHIAFVNWLPRAWSDGFIRIFGRQKAEVRDIGHQKLSEMHYYTWNGISRLLRKNNFQFTDIRVEKIRKKTGAFAVFLLPIYFVARTFYLDSFHILFTK